MKKLLFLLFIIHYPLLIANAQVTQQWVARYSGPGIDLDRANSIKVDASGNIFVTGSVATSFDNWDYLTIKYNSSGVQQWARTYNGPGNFHDQSYSIALDNSGSVYVTGGSFGNGTERDFCTIKYNSAGDSQWVRRYNGPGNDIDEAISVIVDASGNVYVTGYSDDGINLNYHTIKYDSAGTIKWSATYNFPTGGFGSEDRPHDMKVDAGGNVYVTGESSDGVAFLDMYATVKYNSSGQQQWVARYQGGAEGLSQAYSLAVDVSGNVYVTGRSDPSDPFGFNFDILTIKYNFSGVQQWVQRYNGTGNSSDIGNAIALDSAGNIIVAGLSVAGSADLFTIKYGPSGDTLWTARYDGPVNSVDAAASLVIDGSDNIYIAGFSTGSGTLRDYSTVKYNSSGVQQWVQRYNGPVNNDDEVRCITIDGAGNVYISGMSTGSGTGMDFATIKYSQLTPTPPPTPTQVVSRKLHSGAPFDIDLPLTGNSGVECRNGGASNDYSVVFTFPDAVTFSAAFVSGTGSVSSTSGSGTTTITVNLTGVTNAQTIGVILFGVNNGMSTSDVSVPMGVLFGDSNGDRFANAGDALQTRNRSGQATDANNFRSDVNADGFVNSGDALFVRSRSGTSLP